MLPSGRQHTIVHGADHATIVEVGAGLRTYVAGGREVLEGYAEDALADGSRGEVLIPWPNRIGDGRYSWDGVEHQLPLSEPARSNAIHGLVRFAPWTCADQTTSRVEMTHVVHPHPGYPFSLALTVAYELDDDGLRVTTTATNVGDVALPYAAGYHPYLSAGDDPVDDCTLELPAATVVATDDRGLPTGEQRVEEAGLDFRRARPIGDVQLDTAFTDLDRDADGRAWVRLRRPDGGGADLWADAGHPCVQLYTGDTLTEVDRRRRGLAIEPMTAPPDAFRSGTDVRRLEPGESSTASWGIRPVS